MYCPECGASSQYNGKKPNFCYSCGSAFASAVIETQPIQNLPDELPEEEVRSSTSLNVNKLEVDIDVTFDAAKVYKLGDVVGTVNPDEQQPDDNFISTEQTKEETLNSIREESKTLRRKN